MGKKNKSNRNIWDFTPEEQMKMADENYAVETGQLDLFSLAKINNNVMTENGFTAEIEQLIVKKSKTENNGNVKVVTIGAATEEVEKPAKGDIMATNMEIAEEFDEGKEPLEKFNKAFGKIVGDIVNNPLADLADMKDVEPKEVELPIEAVAKDETPVMARPVKEIIRKVRFSINRTLNRAYVDDGLIPVPVLLDLAVEDDIVGVYDADDVGDKCNLLFLYMISLKHPSAVWKGEELFNDFVADVKSYNSDKFIFMAYNNFVFGYEIDTESREEFEQFLNDESHSVNELLSKYVTLSYECGRLHNAFFMDDINYVGKFLSSTYNQAGAFIDKFMADEDTEIEKDNDIEFEVFDVSELQSKARIIITTVTGVNELDEDSQFLYAVDSDEDFDLDEDDNDEDFEALQESDEDNFSDLVSEEMTVVKSEEVTTEVKSEKEDDSDNFVVDVVRTKS